MLPRFLLLILVVASPAEAADTCYSKFSEPVEKAIQWISQDCKSLVKDEPSNCQRAAGERCQRSYNEARRIKVDVCSGLAGDAAFIKSSQYSAGVASQKDSQDANNALNSDLATVSDSMAKSLQAESAKINALIKENEFVIRADYCTRSATYPVYANRVKILNDNLVSIRKQLEALEKKKKNDAAQANSVAAVSQQRSEGMMSTNPVLEEHSGDKGLKKWIVPALIGGTAAAALYALYKAKDKGAPNPPADLEPGFDDTPGPGGSPPTPSDTSPPPPFKEDPGKFFETNGVLVDPAFSDATKRNIASAVNMFPECHRKKLAGVRFISKPNKKFEKGVNAGRCLPGENTKTSPPTIELNETCQTGMSTYVALIVHELVHVLANRTDMYNRYSKAFHAKPVCGVSRYSHDFYKGTNLNEDFAEIGRFVFYPSSGQMFSGACVNKRIQAGREILQSCN